MSAVRGDVPWWVVADHPAPPTQPKEHVMRNEEVRALIERSVRAEQRVSAWIRAHKGDPNPVVRFEWPDDGGYRDSLEDVVMVRADGARHYVAPADLDLDGGAR